MTLGNIRDILLRKTNNIKTTYTDIQDNIIMKDYIFYLSTN